MYVSPAKRRDLAKGLSSSPRYLNGRIKQEARRKTASIGQQGMGHGLALYLIALMAQSCIRRNSGIIFASDALLCYKLKREYSQMCGFVRARMLLAIVRSNNLLLCISRDKGACIWQQTELTDGVVMALLAPWRG